MTAALSMKARSHASSGGRVLEVDLVLRVHELVVGGERLQPELVAPEEHPCRELARIGDGPDGVDARELVDVAAQAAVGRRVALADEVLELGRDDRRQAAVGVAVDDPLQQRPRADRPVVGAVERPRLAEAPGDLDLVGVVLPPGRRDPERVEVGANRRSRRSPRRRRRPACAAGRCPSRPSRTRRPPRTSRGNARAGCPCRARRRAGRCRGAAPRGRPAHAASRPPPRDRGRSSSAHPHRQPLDAVEQVRA